MQVCPSGHSTPSGSVKLGAPDNGTSRIASNSRCAITSAVPSFRLFEFISSDEGTSCATATRPTSTITVANIISINVNPLLFEAVLLFTRLRFISVHYDYPTVYCLGLPYLRPIAGSIARPYLDRPRRHQNHRSKSCFRGQGTSQIKHIDFSGRQKQI